MAKEFHWVRVSPGIIGISGADITIRRIANVGEQTVFELWCGKTLHLRVTALVHAKSTGEALAAELEEFGLTP